MRVPTLTLAICLGLLANAKSETSEQAEKNIKSQLISNLPPGTETLQDAPYVNGTTPGQFPGSAQNLDLYIPEGKGPFPLIIWVHGGGWHSGDKELFGANLALRFVPKGFAVASLNYRLTKDNAPFPAQIEDCFAALAWLKTHAAQYRLDPERIGVMGHSAGAHLAALMAVAGNTGAFVQNSDASSGIQAAVLWSGPFDLDRENGCWPEGTFAWNPKDPFCETFFPGGAYDRDLARKASVAPYVRSGNPPLLIVHGADDTLVIPEHSVRLCAAMKKAGNTASLRLIPGKGHADYLDNEAFEEALRFFSNTLRHGGETEAPPSAKAR